jgi:hypothetical protein
MASRAGPDRTGKGMRGEQVQTLDEMLNRNLLTTAQHGAIAAWIAHARTPDAIRQMPAPLWRTLELASVLMGVDADLTQPPMLSDEASLPTIDLRPLPPSRLLDPNPKAG